MNIITISGTVEKNSVEKKTDKNGHEYTRFIVSVETNNSKSKHRKYVYRCYCYSPEAQSIKGNDLVFLSGDFEMSVKLDKEERPSVNFDIYVRQIQIANNG